MMPEWSVSSLSSCWMSPVLWGLHRIQFEFKQHEGEQAVANVMPPWGCEDAEQVEEVVA